MNDGGDKVDILNIMEEIEHEFDKCFENYRHFYVTIETAEPYVDNEDDMLIFDVWISHHKYKGWRCLLCANWTSDHGIMVGFEDCGLEKISPSVIWKMMFFETLDSFINQ